MSHLWVGRILWTFLILVIAAFACAIIFFPRFRFAVVTLLILVGVCHLLRGIADHLKPPKQPEELRFPNSELLSASPKFTEDPVGSAVPCTCEEREARWRKELDEDFAHTLSKQYARNANLTRK